MNQEKYPAVHEPYSMWLPTRETKAKVLDELDEMFTEGFAPKQEEYFGKKGMSQHVDMISIKPHWTTQNFDEI